MLKPFPWCSLTITSAVLILSYPTVAALSTARSPAGPRPPDDHDSSIRGRWQAWILRGGFTFHQRWLRQVTWPLSSTAQLAARVVSRLKSNYKLLCKWWTANGVSVMVTHFWERRGNEQRKRGEEMRRNRKEMEAAPTGKHRIKPNMYKYTHSV